MQLFNLVLLFNLFQAFIAMNAALQINYNHRLRNLGLKAVILKHKELPKLVSSIKYKYKLFYEKVIATIAEGMIEYEKLTYEEKEIIDKFISTFID